MIRLRNIEKYIYFNRKFIINISIILIISVKLFASGGPEVYIKPDKYPNGEINSIEYFSDDTSLLSKKDTFLQPDLLSTSSEVNDNFSPANSKLISYLKLPELGYIWFPDNSYYIYKNKKLDEVRYQKNGILEISKFYYFEDRIELRKKTSNNIEYTEYVFIINGDTKIVNDEKWIDQDIGALFILSEDFELKSMFEVFDFHEILYIRTEFNDEGSQTHQIIQSRINTAKNREFNFYYENADEHNNWTDIIIERSQGDVFEYYGTIHRKINYK